MSPRKLATLASIAALALALSLAGMKPALATIVCDSADLTGEVFPNPCPNGTDVTITKGTAKACLHEIEDGNGGQHGHIAVEIHAQGQGSDGNRYVIHENVDETVNLNSGGALNHTLTVQLNVIGQGKAPNFRCKVTAHITQNANGTITVNFEKFTEDCECLPL